MKYSTQWGWGKDTARWTLSRGLLLYRTEQHSSRRRQIGVKKIFFREVRDVVPCRMLTGVI